MRTTFAWLDATNASSMTLHAKFGGAANIRINSDRPGRMK
jgi:hypothetical protein